MSRSTLRRVLGAVLAVVVTAAGLAVAPGSAASGAVRATKCPTATGPSPNLTVAPASSSTVPAQLPVGAAATMIAAGLFTALKVGEPVTFTVVCGPNHGRHGTVKAALNQLGITAQVQAKFPLSDTGGAGTDTVAVSVPATGSAKATTVVTTITWAPPVNCKQPLKDLGYLLALQCAAASSQVHTILTIGQCALGVASLFFPEASAAASAGKLAKMVPNLIKYLKTAGKALTYDKVIKQFAVSTDFAKFAVDLETIYRADKDLDFAKLLTDSTSVPSFLQNFAKFLKAARQPDVIKLAEALLSFTALGPCLNLLPKSIVISTVTQIAAGGWHTCALTSDADVQCWGDNEWGQLGNGTTTSSDTAVAVTGLAHVTTIAASFSSTCALTSDGTAHCWGGDINGVYGDGTVGSTTPVTVAGLAHVTAITTGADHTCALTSDGTARCWGKNYYGELGNGTTTDSSTPVTVTGLTHVTAITAGLLYTCAVTSDGTAHCWGRNYDGELGNRTTTDSSTPVTVAGLTHVTAITAGAGHTCALTSDGTAHCWGRNYDGELGNGTTTDSSTPVTVAGLTHVTAITASEDMSGDAVTPAGEDTCAVTSDGTAHCWGSNQDGELGDGTTTDSSTPVTVAGLTRVTAVTGRGLGGFVHMCALTSDGTAHCWGDNGSGELGNGTTTNSSTPVTVTGLP